MPISRESGRLPEPSEQELTDGMRSLMRTGNPSRDVPDRDSAAYGPSPACPRLRAGLAVGRQPRPDGRG
jgi:hypothetical protein